MASKKIPCGGFGYDDNDFEFVTPVGGGIPTLKSKGGAVPEEVTNAVETHGMGWTDEEPVPAINITWDGNTEGVEKMPGEGFFYRLYNEPLSKEQISGAYCEYVYEDTTYEGVLEYEDNEEISSDGFLSYNLIYDDSEIPQVIMVIEEDVEYEGITFHKGVYFCRPTDDIYTSKLLVEASTVETVHKIDEKYIPSSGSSVMVVNTTYADEGVALDKTYAEISSALPNVVVNIESTGDVAAQYILPYTFSLTQGNITTLYFSVSTFYQPSVGAAYVEIKINSNNEVEFTNVRLEAFTP